MGARREMFATDRSEGPYTEHGKPADVLLRDPHRDKILAGISDKTLERFEALFKAINATLTL